MDQKEKDDIQKETLATLKKFKNQCPLTEDDLSKLEFVDFGLKNIRVEGLQLITLQEAQQFCVRVLIMLPNQTEPEHWHPPFDDTIGKEELLRVVAGQLRVYTQGEETLKEGFIVSGKEHCYTARCEHILNPAEQIFFAPGKDGKHWFQGGKDGAIVLCLAGKTKDKADYFTDPNIIR